MIARPVTIGGLAFFANAPFGQVVALPHLLLSWVDCMRLTLMTFIKPPSRAMQLGGGCLSGWALLFLVCVCAGAAHVAGKSRVHGAASMRVDLAALAVKGLVVWGQSSEAR